MASSPDLVQRLQAAFESAAMVPLEHMLPAALDAVPESLRLAMALPPGFTLVALESVATGAEPLVRSLVDQGIVEAEPGALPASPPVQLPVPPSGVPTMGLPDAVRSLVVSKFIGRGTSAAMRLRQLLEECARIGASFLRAGQPTDATLRWALLAQHAHSGEAMARELDRQVDRAAAPDRHDAIDLSRWIDTARPLASLLEQAGDIDMSVAVQRASRRLELLQREKADRRHLDAFHEIHNQTKALETFIQGGPERWQLHLLGHGAAGKTMLLRHFSVRMAAALNVVTARVDFDFLNPDFPRLDPGLLLWALGRELRLHDHDGLASKTLDQADILLTELRDQLRLSPQLAASRRATDHDAFREALGRFIDALGQLPAPNAPGPTVLVLDTCEELVKGRSGGGAADPVTETFRILGALKHGVSYLDDEISRGAGASRLKVLFAGRRPLARAGSGWTSASDLPARPELEVFELTGFSETDGTAWLQDLHCPPDLIPPILKATPRLRPVAGVVWQDKRPAEPPGLEPYELKHFADWARSDPRPTAAAIESGSPTHYVQQRILSRLEDTRMAALLPAVTLLKYFDRELLQPLVDLGTGFPMLFDRLKEHEWIAKRSIPGGADKPPRDIYEVEEGLRRRLWRYYDGTTDFAAIAGRAREQLRRRTLDGELGAVDFGEFDAALRVSAYDDDGGRAWWRDVVQHVLARRDVRWLFELADFLVEQGAAPSEPSPNAPPESPISADVMATRAGTLARIDRLPESFRAWADVRSAVNDWDNEAGARLWTRAANGQSVAAVPVEIEPLGEAAYALTHRWRSWRGTLDGSFAASFVAGYEAIVEQAELLAALQPLDVARIVKEECEPLVDLSFPRRLDELLMPEPSERRIWSPDRDIVAFAWCLAARAAGLAGQPERQREAFDVAIDLTRFEAGQRFAVVDWTPPHDTAARIRLELACTVQRPEWIEERLPVSELRLGLYDGPDHDRYWAVRLETAARTRLHDFVSPDAGEKARTFPPHYDDESALAELMRLPIAGPAIDAVAYVHRLIAPAAIVAARLAAERGRVTDGCGLLQNVLRQSQSLPGDVVLHAERAVAVLIPRWRIATVDLPLLQSSGTVGNLWRLHHELVVAAGAGAPVLEMLVELKGDHQPIDELRLAFARLYSRALSNAPAGADTLAALLDRLDGSEGVSVGNRQMAQLYWEVGDLFGLVGDAAAARALRDAGTRFERAGDRVGTFVCAARRCLMHASVPPPAAGSLRPSQVIERRRQDASEAKQRATLLEQGLADAKAAYRNQLAAPGADERPDWAAFEIDDVRGLAEATSTNPGPWTPWLTRIALCYVRLHQLQGGRLRFTQAECRHIRERIDETPDIAALLSADPADQPLPAPAASAAESGIVRLWSAVRDRAEAARASVLQQIERRIAKWLGMAVGVLFSLAIVWALFTLVRGWLGALAGTILPWYSGWGRGTVMVVDLIAFVLLFCLLGVAVVASIAFPPWLGQTIRRRRRHGTMFTLDTRSDAGTGRTARQQAISISLARITPRFPWPGTRTTVELQSPSIVLEPGVAYRELAARLNAPELLATFKPWLSDGSEARITIRIVTDEGPAHRAAWEPTLAHALGGGTPLPPAVFRVVRSTRDRRPAAETRGVDADVLVVTRQRAGQSVAMSLWQTQDQFRTLVVTGSNEVGRSRAERNTAAPTSGRTLRALHLIGDPTGSNRDVRLSLSESVGDQGRLEQASELAAIAGAATLCVVQASVISQFAPRTTSDRRDAANLREFASELSRAGGPIVVMLPALTVSLAKTALAPLVGVHAGGDLQNLLDRVAEVRRVILDEHPDRESDDRFELAWDVCVLTR